MIIYNIPTIIPTIFLFNIEEFNFMGFLGVHFEVDRIEVKLHALSNNRYDFTKSLKFGA